MRNFRSCLWNTGKGKSLWQTLLMSRKIYKTLEELQNLCHEQIIVTCATQIPPENITEQQRNLIFRHNDFQNGLKGHGRVFPRPNVPRNEKGEMSFETVQTFLKYSLCDISSGSSCIKLTGDIRAR